MEFWLSATGMPLLVVSVGRWPRIAPVLRAVEIPATRPLCGSVTLSQCRPLTELRLRQTRREPK
jgi:hypothetical protein